MEKGRRRGGEREPRIKDREVSTHSPSYLTIPVGIGEEKTAKNKRPASMRHAVDVPQEPAFSRYNFTSGLSTCGRTTTSHIGGRWSLFTPFFLLLKTCSPSLCLVCFVNFTRTLKGLGSTSDASRLPFCCHHINPFSFPFRSFLLLLLYTMRSQQLRPDQLVWPPRPLFFWYSVVVLPCPLSDFLLKPVLFFFFYFTFFAS